MEYLRAESKTGGSSFFRLRGESGETMHVRVDYHEVQKPHRILYTQTFCDEEGRPSRPPFAETWPTALLMTITLTEEDSRQTRVTVQSQIDGVATSVEQETFRRGKADMATGWTASLDKVEALLNEASAPQGA